MSLTGVAPLATWCLQDESQAPPMAVQTVTSGELGHVPPQEHRSPPIPVDDRPPVSVAINEPPADSPPGALDRARRAATFEGLRERVESWLPGIVLAWLVGVVLAAVRPLASWFTIQRLRRVGVSPLPGSVHAILERTARSVKVRQAVGLLQSTLVKTPVVVGYLRPVVLLPVCVVTGLTQSQLELILAHELAHIRRHDYLVNLVQTLVETLFFYHPAVWWLSRQIRDEREHCCDDLVLANAGNRADYGRALLTIEELRSQASPLALAARGGSLVVRIRRIAGSDHVPRVGVGGPAFLLLVAAVGVFVTLSVLRNDRTAAAVTPAHDKDGGPSDRADPAGKRTLREDAQFVWGKEVNGLRLGLALVGSHESARISGVEFEFRNPHPQREQPPDHVQPFAPGITTRNHNGKWNTRGNHRDFGGSFYKRDAENTPARGDHHVLSAEHRSGRCSRKGAGPDRRRRHADPSRACWNLQGRIPRPDHGEGASPVDGRCGDRGQGEGREEATPPTTGSSSAR